jgi:CheY-like chemotaxis protein
MCNAGCHPNGLVIDMKTELGEIGSGQRVLVVEDNDDIRLLLNLWLADDPRCGSFSEVDSVAHALDVARTGDYDTVVLDYMLGDGTACDCLPQLRNAWPDARIVVYTANVRIAREAGIIDLGADVVVEKVSVVVEDVIELVLGDEPVAAA